MTTKATRKAAIREAAGQRLRCPECKEWILCVRGRLILDHHIESAHPDAWARRQAYVAELLGQGNGDFENA